MDGQSAQSQAFTLPAALLAQYPALQTLQWDQLATQADDNSDFRSTGGTSNFDASSGGEFGFGDDDDQSGLGSGYVSASGQGHSPSPQDQLMGVGVGQGGNSGGGGGGWNPHAGGWTSDYDAK